MNLARFNKIAKFLVLNESPIFITFYIRVAVPLHVSFLAVTEKRTFEWVMNFVSYVIHIT